MGLAENLKRIRTERGLSQTALAEKSGVSQQLISQLERGENVSTTCLPALAAALGVEVPELDPDYAGGKSLIRAPLISWVNAGPLADPNHEIDLDGAKPIFAPDLDPNGKWIALRVENDSMNKISPPESVILVNLKDRTEVLNACYVIANEHGEATYKRYRLNPRNRPTWHPVSTNKKHKALKIKEVQGVRIVGRVRRSIIDM